MSNATSRGARAVALLIALIVVLSTIAGQTASAQPPKGEGPKATTPAVDRTMSEGSAPAPRNSARRHPGTIEDHAVPPLVEPAKQPAAPTRFHPLVPPKVVELSAPNAGPTARDRVLQGTELTREVRTAAAHARSANQTAVGERTAAQSTTTAAAEAPLRGVQVSPADNAVSQGTTPTLKAKIAEPAAGVSYVYQFTVCPGTTSSGGSECSDDKKPAAQSTWTTASWKVPSGKLTADKTYSWSVSVSEGAVGDDISFGTMFNDIRVFATGNKLSAPDSATPVLSSPADAAVLSSNAVTLKASISRPVSGSTYQYQFSVTSFDDAVEWESSWQKSSSITVPTSALYWNRGYTWSVSIRDNPYIGTLFNPERSFYLIVPVASSTKSVQDRLAPYDHGVSIASGAFSAVSSDAAVAVAGGSVAIARAYRSVDPTSRALGSGWSSIFDMSVSTPSGAAGPVVRFADGHSESFAKNPNGSYAGAPGNLRTSLTKCSTCTSWTVTDTDGVAYGLDGSGVLSIKNASGNLVKITRDSTTKKPTLLKDAASSRALAVTWSGSHITKLTAQPAPTGVTSAWTYTYSGDKLTKACIPYLGSTVRCTAYAYADTGVPTAITSITNPDGTLRATLTYATGGLATSTKDSAGSTWSFARAAVSEGTQTTVSGPAAAKTIYVTDALSRVTSQAAADGGHQTWVYDGSGRLAKYTNPTGGGIALGYTDAGQIESRDVWVTPSSSTQQCFTYYATTDAKAGKLKSIQDPRGWFCGDNIYVPGTDMFTYNYDSKGRLSEEVRGTESTSPRQKYAYTAGTETAVGGGTVPSGLLAKVTDAGGGATSYAYGSDGLVRTTTDPAGLLTTYGYDSLGRSTSLTTTIGSTTSTTTATFYDDATPRSETGPTVADPVSGVNRQLSTSRTLDPNGRAIADTTTDLVSGTSLTTSYTYDALSRVTKVTGPDGSVQAATSYDPNGNVLTATDARGTTTKATYDALGRRLTSTTVGYQNPITPAAAHDIITETNTYDLGGRLSTSRDARGQLWRYGYTADDRLTSVVAVAADAGADLSVVDYAYDDFGNLSSVKRDNGRSTWTGTYDSLGQLASETDDHTRTTSHVRDAAGRITKSTITGADGTVDSFTRFVYDTAGRVTLRAQGRSSDERVERFGYDQAGHLIQATDPRGSTAGDPAWSTDYRFDAFGELISIKGPEVDVTDQTGTRTARPTVQLGYDTFGRQSRQIDERGAVTTITYDKLGQAIQVALPTIGLADGSSGTPKVAAAFNAAGDRLSDTDQEGRVTSYRYDSLGQAVAQTEPPAQDGGSPRTRTWSYSDAGDLLEAVDAAGHRTTGTWDSLGRQTAALTWTGASSQATTFGYDAASNLVRTTDPLGNARTTTYDASGQVLATTDADGVRSSFGYDVAGRPTKMDNGLHSEITEYDGLGNATKVSRFASGSTTALDTTTSTYDPAGHQLSSAGPLGTKMSWTYDATGSQTAEVYADGSKTSRAYDAAGAITKLTDQRGHATTVTRNAAGWPTAVTEPSTASASATADRTWTYAYDAEGNAVTSVAPGGVTTRRTFDADGQVLAESGSGGGAVTATRSYGYDPDGRLTRASHPQGTQTFSYDGRGLLTGSAGPAGTSSYGYDAAGRMTSQTGASGTATLSWTRANRLASVTSAGASRTYSYDTHGQLTSESLPGTTRAYTYDVLGQLLTDKVTAAGSTSYSWTGTYDAAGRLTSKTIAPAGASGAGATTYGYDSRSRLTSWTDPKGTQHSLTFDAANNLTGQDATTSTYDERNRLLTAGAASFTWSARGTRQAKTSGGATTTYAYDAFDRLTSDGASTYTYDALDRLASAGSDRLSYLGTEAEPASTATHQWLRARGNLISVDGAQALTNTHGDLVALLSATGATSTTKAYTPLGSVTSAGAASALGFQSQWTAASGLTHMQARWYDPTTGSFLTRDSAQVSVEESNRYAYGVGNPVGNADPTGAFVCGTPVEREVCTVAAKQIAKSVGKRAAIGAAAGSVEPGLGTVVGTVIGVGLGAWDGYHLYKDIKSIKSQPVEIPRSAPGSHTRTSSSKGSRITTGGIGGLNLHVGGTNIPRIGGLGGIGGITIPRITIPEINVPDLSYLANLRFDFHFDFHFDFDLDLPEWMGPNWANVPDHSEKLTVRQELLERPIGVLPIDADRLCAISAKACQLQAADTAGDLTAPVDLQTSFAPKASVPQAGAPADPVAPAVPAPGQPTDADSATSTAPGEDESAAADDLADGYNGARRDPKTGKFAPNPDRVAPVPKPSVHGNSRQSTTLTWLYRRESEDGTFLKWGITQDLRRRYSTRELGTDVLIPVTSGTRSDMLDLERRLIESQPGPLNKDRWLRRP